MEQIVGAGPIVGCLGLIILASGCARSGFEAVVVEVGDGVFAGDGPVGPCETVGIGTACADGTTYAGLSPDGMVPMYMTAENFAAIGIRWNDGNMDQTLTGVDSPVDGDGNTAALITLDSDAVTPGIQIHEAAQYCNDLDAHGYQDWYLPAIDELVVLWNAGAPVGGLVTDSTRYWSSTEASTGRAASLRPSDGAVDNGNKYFSGFNAHCVRQ